MRICRMSAGRAAANDMETQTVLLLILAGVLIALGVAQMSGSRRLTRAKRQRNRTGMLLIVIGFVVGLIVFITRA